VLLGLFSLLNAMITYHGGWLQLTGRLLGLWTAGAVILAFLRETLTRDLFKVTARYGKTLFRWTLVALLYVLIVIGLFWTANVFEIRQDVLALFKSALSVSIVIVLFQLFLRKRSFLSLFPELPHRSYQSFIKFFATYYYPLITISGIAGLLWCFGYKSFGLLLLTKIWITTAAYLVILLIYYTLNGFLKSWSEKRDLSDEAAQLLVRTLKSLLLYATVIASMIVFLNLFGLINPLQRLMSFGIFQLGDTQVSLWLIVKAILILLGFIFTSRILQAYLDYKVYPELKIDPGLAYALNTFFKYVTLAIGFLISLKIIGIDLRFLLVFAGAIGIGIGLGLQSMAANVISGFTIIFGGKIRRGDWIEVSGTLGMVTDIYLRATKVRTRDNIEYLIPNSDLITNTIVNYSLSSPMIRIEVPVGVSYGADPREVEKIMLHVAEREPLVSGYNKPSVKFIEYADSSINFELLVWIDVRKVPRREIRSSLYFTLFDEFKKAGIEIPFPQRDIHIRSKVE
jgi:small-conductance mechanosensitive channel